MKNLGIGELAAIVGGRLQLGNMPPLGGELEPVGRVVRDCQQVQAGDLFWEFETEDNGKSCEAEEAMARGAQGVIVAGRHVEPWAGRFCIEVDESRLALWQLASWIRRRFTGQVIAVTGSSCGKTAAKMIDAVLNQCNPRHSTVCQLEDSNLALPLSMLNIDQQDDFAVLELAVAKDSQFDAQMRLCCPHVGVITDVDDIQLSAVDAVKELMAALLDGGCAVLNGDDPRLRRAAAQANGRILWVGRTSQCDVRADNVHFADGRLTFSVEGLSIEVQALGRHQLHAALAAYAVARLMEVEARQVANLLSSIELASTSRCVKQANGVTVIHAGYNAGEADLISALSTLRDYRTNGKRIVVCGDIAEWEAEGTSKDPQLGEQVVTTCGADLLVTCGQNAKTFTTAARQAGMADERILDFTHGEQAVSWLAERLNEEDVVLVYGRPITAMQHIANALVGEHSTESKETQQSSADADNNIFRARPLTSLLRESNVALPPG